MLNMYDLLLEKNQRIVDVYLLNIQDFLSTFCIQLDASSSRIMSAQVVFLSEVHQHDKLLIILCSGQRLHNDTSSKSCARCVEFFRKLVHNSWTARTYG